jgi:hypothetical protein
MNFVKEKFIETVWEATADAVHYSSDGKEPRERGDGRIVVQLYR